MSMDCNANDTEREIEITIVDILEYVGESIRPIKEGHAVFVANHILCIGWTKFDTLYVDILAYVTQSSHPAQTPHTVNLKIGGNVSQWILRCSCKAGTAKCKHIVACLLLIEKFRKLVFLSCTDVTQVWGISKAGKSTSWGARKVSEMCCFKPPKKVPVVDKQKEEAILAESFERILTVSKQSALYKHIEGRFMNDMTSFPNRALQAAGFYDDSCTSGELEMCLKKELKRFKAQPVPFNSEKEKAYYEKQIQVDIDKSTSIAIDTKDQNTNDWKIHRTSRITASTCYALYTYISNQSANWDKKIESYWSMRTLNVKATKYGKETETLALECYRRTRNPLVKRCGLVIHPHESWIGGSPDGVDPEAGVILEIKCPGNADLTLDEIICTANVAKYLRRKEGVDEFILSERHMYYCQVQINMWVLNCSFCDFIVYSKKEDDFILVEVPYNGDFVENVVNDLKKLYFEKMLQKLIK